MEKINLQHLLHMTLIEGVDVESNRLALDLNLHINKLLRLRGEIKNQVTRARALNSSTVSVNYHATFNKQDLLDFLNEYFPNNEFQESEIFSKIKDTTVLSKQNNLLGSQSSGAAGDEPGIDDKVKTIVDALNSIPGIATFSSCEGHYNAPFYVLWILTNNNLRTLNTLIKIWNTMANQSMQKYNFNFNEITANFNVGYDSWSSPERYGFLNKYRDIPYFEFRIRPNTHCPWDEKFYDFMEDMSNGIATEIKNTVWEQ
jgi:hypothetical protein